MLDQNPPPPTEFPTLKLVHTEPPAINQLQFMFFCPDMGSHRVENSHLGSMSLWIIDLPRSETAKSQNMSSNLMSVPHSKGFIPVYHPTRVL